MPTTRTDDLFVPHLNDPELFSLTRSAQVPLDVWQAFLPRVHADLTSAGCELVTGGAR